MVSKLAIIALGLGIGLVGCGPKYSPSTTYDFQLGGYGMSHAESCRAELIDCGIDSDGPITTERTTRNPARANADSSDADSLDCPECVLDPANATDADSTDNNPIPKHQAF